MCILYNIYNNNIKEAIKNNEAKYKPVEYFKPTLVGHYFFLSMAPNNKQKPRFKIKTFKRFEPTGKIPNPIDMFNRYHVEFSELLGKIPELTWIDGDRLEVEVQITVENVLAELKTAFPDADLSDLEELDQQKCFVAKGVGGMTVSRPTPRAGALVPPSAARP